MINAILPESSMYFMLPSLVITAIYCGTGIWLAFNSDAAAVKVRVKNFLCLHFLAKCLVQIVLKCDDIYRKTQKSGLWIILAPTLSRYSRLDIF